MIQSADCLGIATSKNVRDLGHGKNISLQKAHMFVHRNRESGRRTKPPVYKAYIVVTDKTV
jgi:hypothetical protein